jgi:putative FmdB family regulatory protein
MPIYEFECADGHVFERLVAAGGARKKERCPSCGGKSERMISTFAIHAGAPIRTASERAVVRDLDVTKVKLPNMARLCGMDDYSATRLAAHKLGRGHEFDDKMAKRQERQAARGEAPKKKAAAHKSGHHH